MHGKVELEFVDQGFIDVLTSEGVYNLLQEQAEGIASRAGEGFSVEILRGTTRWNAIVHSDTLEAAQAESEDKVLSRAVGG